MAIVKGFTPSQRGPSLKDGTGGTSERPAARERSPILRNPDYVETDIRLTPTGTDVSTGVGALYDFGPVDQKSIGMYRGFRQGAASTTADPLGDREYVEFEIKEQTAGVFQAVGLLGDEGGTAIDDADDPQASDATMAAVADAELNATASDSRATFFVATSADVTDAAAWTAPATLVEGHLYLLDAVAAATHVFDVQRTR